jgi:NADPH:quinone reductase-like Zn-dependent oxidoreductase
MKAVVLTGTGGPDVLRVQDWPDPAVGAGEVRIAVRAAGVSFAETIARVGLYPGNAETASRPPTCLGR